MGKKTTPCVFGMLMLGLSIWGCGSDDDDGGRDAATDLGSDTRDAGGSDAGEGDSGAATDAGRVQDAAGATFAGCEGSGACEDLSQVGCDVGAPLGCVPAYEGRCNVRGCTSFDIGACGTDDMGCVWNEVMERCEDDPVCPTLTSETSCLDRGCSWVETLAGCTGTYECSALSDGFDDAGALPTNPCEMVNGFGLSCVSRYE